MMVMMMTAEDESKMVVTMVPVITAENVLEVNFKIHFFAFSPTAFCIVSERLFTANKNNTSPARIDSIISVILR
jgi:hypothetical protein